MIEVFCTWNKFFLSARAEEKSEAEQNAARATLNKVELYSFAYHTFAFYVSSFTVLSLGERSLWTGADISATHHQEMLDPKIQDQGTWGGWLGKLWRRGVDVCLQGGCGQS